MSCCMAQGPMSSILVMIRPDPGVRNPHSLDNRKSYQRILLKFYGELGSGLETNRLHFGDDPDHRPDPGVRSPKYGFTGLSIMLALGGGLRSLRTSSSSCACSWGCCYQIFNALRLCRFTTDRYMKLSHISMTIFCIELA